MRINNAALANNYIHPNIVADHGIAIVMARRSELVQIKDTIVLQACKLIKTEHAAGSEKVE